MSRLDTIRAYFADRFFSTLVNDPRLATLQYPAELFSGVGHFTVPSTVAGLTQIPTLANLDQRIATTTGAEQADLQAFRDIEVDALATIVPGVAERTSVWGRLVADAFAPVVNHPDGQDFFPASMHDLLNYSDGTLAARYYSASGQQSLPGQIFPLLFDNPEVINAAGLPGPLYQSRQPFAAVLGVAPPETGFPADVLDSGRLNLAPAVARLGPGRLAPTLYAEIKGLTGALRLNQAYQSAALTGGQYAPLRNNRIHTDPLLASAPDLADTVAAGGALPGQPIMVVYHGFYPADDEARRRPGIGATNREFHHLGYGILVLPDSDAEVTDTAVAFTQRPPGNRGAFLFTCTGPDTIRMFPLDHPVLTMVNDEGDVDPTGTHAELYFANMSPAGWEATFDSYVTHGQSTGSTVGFYLGAIGAGALVGLAAGPIGAAIGAAVVAAAELIYLLFALFCALTGACSSEGAQSQGGGPPVDDGGNVYGQSVNVLSPPGVTLQGGGPTRSFALDLIPHFPDRNLYGIDAAGDTTFSITNDAGDEETLAWLGFPGGLGYQFDHTVPGPTDVAGSSLRNYFQLFTEKFLAVEEARTQVTYFA